MREEYGIARQTVLAYIKKGEPFKYSQVKKTILDHGGIMRVSVGVTVKDYLEDFDANGVIKWSVVDDDIFYTVI